MVNNMGFDPEVYSAMSKGKPFKSYKKVIVGKIFIHYLDQFSGEQKGAILQGDPRKKNELEGCIFDVYSERENEFFKKMNRRHFEKGYLLEYKRVQEDIEKSPNEITDEEIEEYLNSPFLKLQNRVAHFTSVAPLWRFLVMAKDMEKSEKIFAFLESKISELQAKEYGLPVEKSEG